MALKECWECGQPVSRLAKTCPSCGVKDPGSKTQATLGTCGQAAFGLGIILTLLLVGVIFAAWQDRKGEIMPSRVERKPRTPQLATTLEGKLDRHMKYTRMVLEGLAKQGERLEKRMENVETDVKELKTDIKELKEAVLEIKRALVLPHNAP